MSPCTIEPEPTKWFIGSRYVVDMTRIVYCWWEAPPGAGRTLLVHFADGCQLRMVEDEGMQLLKAIEARQP